MKQLIGAFAATFLICAPAIAAPADTSQSNRTTSNAEAASLKSGKELKVRSQLLNGLKPADDISPRLAKIKSSITALSARNVTKQSQQNSLRAGLREINALDQSFVKLRGGLKNAERTVGSIGGPESVDAARRDLDDLRKAFEDSLEELENENKLGNFKIQGLMSGYKKSEKAASDVEKKRTQTTNSILGNWK